MPFLPDTQFKPDQPPIEPTPQKSLLRKTGEFLGDITGAIGFGRGIKEAGKVAKGLITGKEVAPEVGPKEFLGSTGKVALTASIPLTGGVSAGIRGGVGLAARMAESGLIGAGFQVFENLEKEKPVTKDIATAATIGGGIPLAGTALHGAKKFLGKGLQATGEKIQTMMIRPTKVDIEDGFDIRNVNKYGLGGTLKQTAEKTENRISDLASQLSKKIGLSKERINLLNVAQKTSSDLTLNKARAFGDIGSIEKKIDSLLDEIKRISPNGIVPLDIAQAVKQASGHKGAWVFGNADPDARAVERVYTAFYRNLRKEIERAAPPGIQGINNQLSELIPIQNAIIRRLPVAERNNMISLPDLIAAAAATISPYSLIVLVGNRLAKSGRVGAKFAELGKGLSREVESKTNIGKRVFGR